MNSTSYIGGMVAILMASTFIDDASAQKQPTYSIVERVAGSGGIWDYAIVDEFSNRLYIAQKGVTALDLTTGEITTGLVSGEQTHGIVSLEDGTVAVDDSASKTVKVFDGVSGKVLGIIPVDEPKAANGVHSLDAMVREPKTGLIVVVNGEAGILFLVDVKLGKVVGTISVGGKPEFVAADGSGNVYVNVNKDEASEIVKVDIPEGKVLQRFPLEECKGATGIAYDNIEKLLISVCENGLAKFVRPDSGAEVASVSVGEGADAVFFDPTQRLAFVPGAKSGTLVVIAVRGMNNIAVVQTLATQKGTRLGAVDTRTGKLYLPAARFGPPVPPVPFPSVVSGSFEILVAAPQ
jgi:streptogramin lyase